MFIGNAKILAYFADIAKENIWSQGYCLVGPNNVGKRKLTAELATHLLGVTEDKVVTHPDYLYLGRAVDEKTGKPKTEISVAQARQLRATLAGKPWGTGYRVAVIDQAETLSIEAANALLKIVEEPPERTIIFFLTESTSALPATILSRTEILYLSLVPGIEIKQGLQARGVSEAEASEIAELAWGRPGRAINLQQNEEWRQSEERQARAFSQLIDASFAVQSELIGQLTEKKDNARTADTANDAIDAWLMAARELVRSNAVLNDQTKLARLNKLIDDLHQAKIDLRKNVNPRLLLETIFFSN